MKLLILTGMSGAGKHTAFKILEDFGYRCVDNLPVELLKSFVELNHENGDDEPVAVGIDVRGGASMDLLRQVLPELEADGMKFEILFLDAEDVVLVKRYKETRRTHPLSGATSIYTGIAEERERVQFLRDRADYIVDTSHLLTRELRAELQKIFIDQDDYKNLFVTVMSFGFKYGIPQDADLVFDVRFLPNPYYIAELRPLTGNDEAIQNFVMQNDDGPEFADKLEEMIRFLIPRYIDEGKNQLVIAFGCTGGKHRSVTLANELYNRLKDKKEKYGLSVTHRDEALK